MTFQSQQRAVYSILLATTEACIARLRAPTDLVTTVAWGVVAKGRLFSSNESGADAAGDAFLFMTRTIMYLFSHVEEEESFQPVAVLPWPWPPKVFQPRTSALYWPAVGLPRPKSWRCITYSGVSPVTVVLSGRSSAQSEGSIPDQNLFQSSHTIALYVVLVTVRGAPAYPG